MARRVSYDEFRKNLTNYMDQVGTGPLYMPDAQS
jgi:hypothetical protein